MIGVCNMKKIDISYLHLLYIQGVEASSQRNSCGVSKIEVMGQNFSSHSFASLASHTPPPCRCGLRAYAGSLAPGGSGRKLIVSTYRNRVQLKGTAPPWPTTRLQSKVHAYCIDSHTQSQLATSLSIKTTLANVSESQH